MTMHSFSPVPAAQSRAPAGPHWAASPPALFPPGPCPAPGGGWAPPPVPPLPWMPPVPVPAPMQGMPPVPVPLPAPMPLPGAGGWLAVAPNAPPPVVLSTAHPMPVALPGLGGGWTAAPSPTHADARVLAEQARLRGEWEARVHRAVQSAVLHFLFHYLCDPASSAAGEAGVHAPRAGIEDHAAALADQVEQFHALVAALMYRWCRAADRAWAHAARRGLRPNGTSALDRWRRAMTTEELWSWFAVSDEDFFRASYPQPMQVGEALPRAGGDGFYRPRWVQRYGARMGHLFADACALCASALRPADAPPVVSAPCPPSPAAASSGPTPPLCWKGTVRSSSGPA